MKKKTSDKVTLMDTILSDVLPDKTLVKAAGNVVESPVSPNVESNSLRTNVATPSKSASKPTDSLAKQIGRFEVLKKLGEGGMGVVYHALDPISQQEVAVKVLAANCSADPELLRRFEKEARLLEEAKNPHIANLLEVGSDGDSRFLVMEFIRGGDLRKWIKKAESFDEAMALELIGDLCRALVTPHAIGMIHRDIKPENILLDDQVASRRPILKLTDFGLARHVDQTESLKLTQTGALLGTPYYMAPEQFTGAHEITPATDVYALGVTFFELLSGARPFNGSDPIQLATAHCFETPPDLRKLNPKVSDAAAELARRMLAKLPGQRPQDASAVLEEIVRLQNGDSSHFVIHPVLPAYQASTLFEADYEWTLAASPAELWPFISNTDRFNQAAGLAPITYQTNREADGRLRKFGQFRLAGMTIRWEEHPFEWIEGQRFSVLREFPSGPFVWFMSTVEVLPLQGGGTQLKHHVKIQPRGVVGKVVAQMEVGIKGKRNLDRIYRRIDSAVTGSLSSNQVVDAFHQPQGIKRSQRDRMEKRLGELKNKGVSSTIVDAFRDLIVNSAAQDLARIRPYAMANRFGLPDQAVVDACLQAVSLGLFTLHWDIICPTCRLSTGATDTLREIERHANCDACQIKFDIEFSSSLELIFRVHPEIRTADAKTYCAGGPGNFPHVVAQVRLEPSERLLLPLSLNSGSYIARGPCLPYAIPIEVDSQTGLRHGRIQCVPGPNCTPVAVLRSGHQSLAVENFFPGEQLIRIERTALRSELLTAAQATALPRFRELFPDQVLAPGLLVEIATTNFLAIRISDLDEVLSKRGDAETYSLLQDFQRIVQRQIHQQGGSVVDASEETVLASFVDVVSALRTAAEIRTALNTERSDQLWLLSGSIHRGPALVTSDRNEMKYFGTTVNKTRQLSRSALPNQLLLTQEIWSDPGVQSERGHERISEFNECVVDQPNIQQMAL